MLFHDFLISFCTSDIFVNHVRSNKSKWLAKISTFITSLRIWQHRDINLRIYSGTIDKWHKRVITSLIWHMTSLGLYYSPDSMIQAVPKSPNAPFGDCPPVRPLHSSNLCCLDICSSSLSPQGRDGGTVYPPVVFASFPQFWSIHRRPLMNRIVYDNRFSVICNTFIRTSYIQTMHQ